MTLSLKYQLLFILSLSFSGHCDKELNFRSRNFKSKRFKNKIELFNFALTKFNVEARKTLAEQWAGCLSNAFLLTGLHCQTCATESMCEAHLRKNVCTEKCKRTPENMHELVFQREHTGMLLP